MISKLWTSAVLNGLVSQARASGDYIVTADDETVIIVHDVTDAQVLAALKKGDADAWIVRYDEAYFSGKVV